MTEAITTKPGDKYASIKKPAVYEALRREGYSKESAARISNAQAKRSRRRRRTKSVDDLVAYVDSAAYDPEIADAYARCLSALPSLKGEQIAPGVTRIRGNLCNVHGRYGRCPGSAPATPGKAKPVKTPTFFKPRKPLKPRKAGGKRGASKRGGAVGKKPANAEAAKRQAQRERERAQDRAARAARQAKRDTEHAQDRAARQAREQQREQERQADRKKREQDRAARQAAQRKRGGGSKRERAPKDERFGKVSVDKSGETARRVGLTDTDVNDLRDAAETGGATSDALKRLGLVGDDGFATDQGRRALSALERGNVRQYQAALQDARARLAREREREQRHQAKREAPIPSGRLAQITYPRRRRKAMETVKAGDPGDYLVEMDAWVAEWKEWAQPA